MTTTFKEATHSLNQYVSHALDWRYAVKKYDPSRKIAPADWATLKESLVKAPSSYGLQPWKFLVIENPALRAELRGASWGQPQVTDASHFVVLLARDSVLDSDIDRYLTRIAQVRGVSIESLAGFRTMLGNLKALTPEKALHWTQRQAYIALGFLLETAALLHVDATPMEGFDPAAYDKILKLEGTGWRSTAVAALGYRHAEDASQSQKKVRYDEKDVIETR